MINLKIQYSNLRSIIGIWLLLITPITLNTTTIDISVISADQHLVNTQEGHFFVSNTTTEVFVFMLNEVPRIGQTWNVTLDLDGNSSTYVHWEARPGSNNENMWEGQNQFTLQVGERVTNQYISHVCGDNYGYISLFFYLTLSNSTAKASGHYSAILIFQGYEIPPECSKGQLIVSDILEWLATQSSDEDPNFTAIFIFGCLMITILIIVKRKRN
jgi:hypothetical protein